MCDRERVIAVDFDGCLCENAWPEIGEAKQDVIDALLSRQKSGAKIILWTCRVGEQLSAAVRWCTRHGIAFDAINENLPVNIAAFGNDCRKVYADEYWDDKAVTTEPFYLFIKGKDIDVSVLRAPDYFIPPDTERGPEVEQEVPPSRRTEHWAIRWSDPLIPTNEQTASNHAENESLKQDSLRAYRVACLESLIYERQQCKRCYIRLRRRALLRHPLRLMESIFLLHQRTVKQKGP